MRPAAVRIATALAVLLALIAISACGSEEQSAAGRKQLDLRIGAILSRTGALSQFGESGQQAADLAVDEVRKAAAKAGARHKVTITYIDDRSQPGKETLDAAKKMADSGTGCMVGAWGSGVTERLMGQIAVPKKILLISPASTGDVISQHEDRGYLFRTVPPDRMQADALVQLLDDKLRGTQGKKVNVGALKSTYGENLTKDFEEAWRAKGGEIGATQTYALDEPTVSVQARALAAGKPDAWVFFDFKDTYSRLANDMLARKDSFSVKRTFGTDGLADARLATASPQASDGLRGVAIGAPKRGAPAEEFDKRYTARGPAKRQTYDAQAFDAVVLCYLSAVAAGSTAGADMKDKIREVSGPPGRKYTWLQLDQAVKALEAGHDIDYDGASGPIDLNSAGDPTAGVYDVYEFKKNKLRTGSEQIAVPERAGGI